MEHVRGLQLPALPLPFSGLPLHGYQSPNTLQKQPRVVLDVSLLSSRTWFSFSVLMQVEKVLL